MAALPDEFASKLVGILAGMVKEEVEMLLGVPGEMTKLETTLRDLSRILADAERRRIRDRNSATEGWVKELKDAMYDADDVLDLCQLMEGGDDPPTPSARKTASRWCCEIPKTFFCFCNPIVAHEIGRKIQAINQQLEDLARRSSRFGFITQAINSSGDAINNTSNFLSSNTGSVFIQSDVVGEKIEEDKKKIVDMLIKKKDASIGSKGNNNDVFVAIAITGTGGIGKTTLAQMVFNDRKVEENFEERIWLSVNHDVNEINVLKSLLTSFGLKHEDCAGNKDSLKGALKDTVQQKKKFLLVMDDVWSDKVWNELLRVPLNDGASGSQVLVTTRNNGVARMMKAQYLHRVDKLETQDAWALLKRQVSDF